jgi:CBS domain containing-hemolysin-like protein
VHDRIGATIPEGAYYETVGGFVMAAVGRVPQVGDEIALNGWMLRVVAMDGRRVDRVRIAPVIPEVSE